MRLEELKIGQQVVGPSGSEYVVLKVTAKQAILQTSFPTEQRLGYDSSLLYVDQVALDRFHAR